MLGLNLNHVSKSRPSCLEFLFNERLSLCNQASVFTGWYISRRPYVLPIPRYCAFVSAARVALWYAILYMAYLYHIEFRCHAVKYEISDIFSISSLFNAQQMSFVAWVQRIPHITTFATYAHLVYVLITNVISLTALHLIIELALSQRCMIKTKQ